MFEAKERLSRSDLAAFAGGVCRIRRKLSLDVL
jgi:hypothetical protein